MVFALTQEEKLSGLVGPDQDGPKLRFRCLQGRSVNDYVARVGS
jgi:hypothetical protein